MKISFWITIQVILLVLLSVVDAGPLGNFFYRELHRGSKGSRRPNHFKGGDDYKRICRVLNPDPYAMIGSNPFPAAPFCPP